MTIIKYRVQHKGKSIDVNCEIIGEGIPVVLLHGYTLDHRALMGCMEPVFRECPGFRRIYVDLPGMGETKVDDSITCSDDVLHIIEGFIETVIPGEHFLLVGESYGGYIERGVLHQMPSRVDGMLLIAPLIHANADRPKHTVLVREIDPLSSLSAEEAAGFEAVSVIQTERILSRYRDEILCGVRIADNVFLQRLLAHGYYFSFNVDDIEEFDKPVAIIIGKQDSWVGYRAAFKLLDRYSHATYSVIDRAGHNVQLDAEHLFPELTSDWLHRVKIAANH